MLFLLIPYASQWCSSNALNEEPVQCRSRWCQSDEGLECIVVKLSDMLKQRQKELRRILSIVSGSMNRERRYTKIGEKGLQLMVFQTGKHNSGDGEGIENRTAQLSQSTVLQVPVQESQIERGVVGDKRIVAKKVKKIINNEGE